MPMKKLYRSRENRMVFGVLGGLGEYFDVDPTIMRLGFLLVLIITAIVPGILLYIVAAIMIPEAPVITPSTPVADDPEEA